MASSPAKQPTWFQKNNITANPTIVKLDKDGGAAFFVDHYTGRTITARVGLPAFLCSASSSAKPDNDKDNPPVLYGAWANWNVMLREIYDANATGDISDELLLGIQSWVAEFANIEGEFELAPPASELQRFNGPLSDSSWDQKFTPNANKAIDVQDDMAARALRQQLRKNSAKEKPPTLAQSISGMCDPNGVTVFDVAVFPANRGQYWVHRRPFDRTNEFEQRVCQDLGVRSLPGNHTSTSVCIAPDANTKKANRLLCKEEESKKEEKKAAAPTPPPSPAKPKPVLKKKEEQADDQPPQQSKKRSITFSRATDSVVPADLYKLPNKKQVQAAQKKPVRRPLPPSPKPMLTQDDLPWPSDIDSQED